MMRSVFFILSSFFLSASVARAQWVLATPETVDDGTMEQLYEDLSDRAAVPLDLNSASRADLEALPCLTPQQVMDILEYRDRVQHIETLSELLLIPSLDRQTLSRLTPFVTLLPAKQSPSLPPFRDLLRHGRHTLLTDLRVPLSHRPAAYLGSSTKHWIRYTFRYGQQVSVGVAGAKDEGEPFFKGRNKYGYDFYTGYVLLKDIGRLQALAVGRYRLRFGMGLILNNSYGFGKLATMTALMNSSTHIFGHASRTESNYLQGVAGTIRICRGLDLTAFASYRKIDATLNKDSVSVATILKSGYHRTISEMNRRRNTSEILAGGHINWISNGFHIGLTGYYASFNRKLKMDKGQTYRRWYPYGYDFYNFSVDYGYLSRKLNISGETATDKNNQIATINMISYELTPRFTLTALQRYYPYKYQALFANSIAEGGSVNDESAAFLGAKWLPWNGATLTFYSDFSYFAWPKYNTASSTNRWDNLIQLDANKGPWDFLLRYRMKIKELKGQKENSLVKKFDHRARLAISYQTQTFYLATQADITFIRKETASNGYMINQTARWQHKWLKLIGTVGYFNTTSYDARVYCYDPGLLYTFSFPSFYGKGVKMSTNIRADVSSKLTLICNCGYVHYVNRPTTTSNVEYSNNSNRTDIEMQLRWKF